MKCVKKRTPHRTLTQKASEVNVPEDYPWVILGTMVEDLRTAGSLSAEDGSLVTQIIRDRDKDALRLLDDLWGLQSITSFEVWPKPENVRARRLLAGLLKKYLFDSDAESRRSLALQKFLQAEEACRAFNHGGYRRLTANGEWVSEVYTHAKGFISSLLGVRPQFDKLVPWIRFGPGATLVGSKRSTSEYFKYAKWPYTVTIGCERYARFVIETDQRWMGALLESYRQRMGIPQHLPINMRRFWSKVFTRVPGNRIGFVPKTMVIDRPIAVEPLMNLRLQLGVDGFIRRGLKRYDVDLDSQEKNQFMASLGSERHLTDRYSTIDLSAASDTVSLKLCQLLLPDEWYSFLYELRSPAGFVAGHGLLTYEKISSMGNGFTFALESLIFSALTYGVLKVAQGSVNFVKDMAVYGDDLIVRESHYDAVVRILQYSGFTVNQEKSFKYGVIKESCGTDWFEGHLVRPVSLSHKPQTVAELFVDFNRLQRTLNLYFGIEPGESKTCSRIAKWIPHYFLRFCGPLSDESFSTHLHSRDHKSHGHYQHGRWRYNRLTFEPVRMKSTSYWRFNFRKMMATLSGTTLCTPPFNNKDLRGESRGNQFAVTLNKDSVTVGESHKPAEGYWQVEYVDVTLGSQFRMQLIGGVKTHQQKRLFNVIAQS